MLIMKQTKGCGCLIGSAVRDLEMLKRKMIFRLDKIDKKIKTIKDSKKVSILKAEKMELANMIKQTIGQKKNVKRRFDEHIRKSGYIPTKFKDA